MRERIDALVPQSRVWVGTFHGICARLLRKYAKLVGIDPGFSIYDQNDRHTRPQGHHGRGRLGRPRLDARADRIGHQPGQERPGPPRHLAAPRRRPQGRPAGPASTRLTSGASATPRPSTSTTCSCTSSPILKEHQDVRADLDRRYRYVLVDEYQDTNLAQYAIVRALSVDHPNLCVTGDPDQSIYGWRGADLTNILEFERDYPGCRVVTLQQNYRSTKNILSVADHLIRNNRNRKPKSLLTENPQRRRWS